MILQTAAVHIPLFVAGRFFAGLVRVRYFPFISRANLGTREWVYSRLLSRCTNLKRKCINGSNRNALLTKSRAPKWIRGTVVGCYQWAITMGLFIAAIVLNSTKDRNDTGSYRIPVAVQFAWAIVLVVGMLILPETPRYLIKRGRHDAAARALSRLRHLDVKHPALVEELAEIQANHEYEMLIGTASYIGCFQKPIRKRLLTGCALQALQQLTGTSANS